MRAWVGVLAVCAGLSMPGLAAADDGRDAPARLESGQVLRGLVRERDVTLLFDFLRASLAAAIEGREAPPVPEELTGRAEALSQVLKAHGALAALAMLATLEKRAKQALREPPARRPALPPTQPFTPL